ncbi:MAG: ROK family protein [Ignavibacteriales bacterium]|nr:ROK family protein [Ignavibacteriales bacterium]
MAKPNKYAIGVDLGGTSIKVGVVSKEGKILKKVSLDTLADGGPDIVIHQIKKGIDLLLEDYKKEIVGIGIGSPGVVSIKKGTVENPPNLSNWKKVHLGKIIEKEYDIKTVVENDANAAAIGELIFGAGKGFSDFIMITLGTGVGGGIIMNRKLYRGETGAAGEIGHITIAYDGKPCNCGGVGCVEAYIGNNYMIERVSRELPDHPESKIFELLDNNLNHLTPKIINDAAVSGDEFAKSIIFDTGKYLGYALATVINILDISTIIIGGGVAGFGKILFDSVEKTTKERTLKCFKDRVKIYPAKLKNEAGIKGASALVFYKS